MPAYHVIHETEYRYRWPVSLSQQLLHLQPRDMPWQRVHSLSLAVSPLPVQRHNGEDSFGNPCTRLEINHPHTVLNVCAEMHLEVMARPRLMAFEDSPAWEKVVEDCCYHSDPIDPEQLEALGYRQESPYIRIKHVFADYALESFSPKRPLLEAVEALMSRIHEEFTFDPEATHVATPLTEVLARKRGVCQDFAHLMLACLRALGIPARYVSGYLLTQPPPGQPRKGETSLKSRPQARVRCSVPGTTSLVGSKSVQPASGHHTEIQACEASAPIRRGWPGGGCVSR